jgi:APA family basic amino acid/polyamine antiporter
MAEARPLSTRHVAAVVVGAIVGVGIFFTPGTLARALPNPAWLLGVWLLGGVASVAGALVFAELGGRYPRSGGIYVFLREGFGPRAGPVVAFLYGWQQLLVVQPCSMAVIAVVLVDHLGHLTGPLGPGQRTAGALVAIVTFTAVNLLGLRTGGRIQLGAAALKIGALALLVALGIGWAAPERILSPPAAPAPGNPASWLVLGLVPVLFTFGGWQHGTFIAGSVRDAERSVPRGIMAGVGVVLALYLAVNVAYLALLGHSGLAASRRPAAEAAEIALGPLAGDLVAGAIVLSAAGILNTICLAFPFVIYAMARDGVFFARAGVLDPRTGRPALAVWIQGAWACLAVLVGEARIDVLLTGIAFADWTFHALTAVVQLRVRRQAPPAGTLRAPFVAAVAFLAVALFVAIGTLVRTPAESAYGAGVLLAGAVAWRIWRRPRT